VYYHTHKGNGVFKVNTLKTLLPFLFQGSILTVKQILRLPQD